MNTTYINPIVLALLTIGAAAFLALGSSEFFKHGSRSTMKANCLLSVIIGVLTGVAVGYMGKAEPLILFAANGCVAATAVALRAYYQEQRHAHVLLTQAHNMQSFLQKLFAEVGEGVLLRATDLEKRVATAADFNEKYFLGFLSANIEDVGHEIGTHPIHVPEPYSMTGSVPATFLVPDYAIGFGDIDTLEQRLWQKYGCWMPGSSRR